MLIINVLWFIYSLWHRNPDIDDAWIGEMVWWMHKVGYAKSELMHGITSQEVRSLVHHKLFSLNGLASVKLFGFSLYSLKIVSLLWLVIFCLVLYRYLLKKFNQELALLVLMLFSINAFVFQFGFVFRPEIMVMTLGFISWIYLERSFEQTRKPYLFLMLSGLFAGLAASGHLNGLIFAGAGGILLLWNKRWVGSIAFGVSALVGFAVYFYDFTRDFGIDYWLMQVSSSPALFHSTVMPKSITFLAKLFREHLRLFHSPREIALSIMVILLIVGGYKVLYKTLKLQMRYLLLLAILLALIAVHTTGKYLLLYLPHMLIVSGLALQKIYTFRKKNLPLTGNINSRQAWPWSLALVIIYIVVNAGWNVKTATNKWNPNLNRELSLKFANGTIENIYVVAPMEFIFDEIKYYGRIQADLSFGDREKAGLDISGPEFIELLNLDGINRLYLTPEYEEKFEIHHLPLLPDGREAVTRLGEFNGLTIYKYNGAK
ncbi:MAG: glycosyltransferase family 39 protein [Lentimicrobiaceae bacterium]|nr:glycosyltransferase family 39 protein [Lentimicrobiaceae bacterium]